MKRKLLILVLFAGAVIAAWMLYRRFGTVETLVRQETRIRSFLAEHAVAGMLIGFASYVLLSLIPGTGGKSVVYGWLFGFWQGVVIANCALTVAAVITFLLSRSVLRDALQSRFSVAMQRLDRAIERDGAFYLLALRMMHTPYTATNYAMGTTCIDLKSFWWATQLGLIPGTIVFIFAGTRIPTLEAAVRQGAGVVFSPQVILSLVIVGLFPLIMRWIWRRFWRREPEQSSEN